MSKPTFRELVSNAVESCAAVAVARDKFREAERALEKAKDDSAKAHKTLGRAAVSSGVVDDHDTIIKVMDLGGGKCVLFQWVYSDPECAAVTVLPMGLVPVEIERD